jgi:hypothetical protein
MIIRNLLRISVLIIISLSLYSCPQPVDLPGDIKGTVTDCETSHPIQEATIKLITLNNTAITGSNGSYLLENVDPGSYVLILGKKLKNTAKNLN